MQAGRGRGRGGLEEQPPSRAIGFGKGMRNWRLCGEEGREGELLPLPDTKPPCSSATMAVFWGTAGSGGRASACVSAANPGNIAPGLWQLVPPS